MGETQVKGVNVGDGSVGRPDLNIATAGQAVITRILEVANSGIKLNASSGIDSGTGDISLILNFAYLNTLYQAKLNGTGLVRMAGTTVGYDNTAYYHSGNLPAYPTSFAYAQNSSKLYSTDASYAYGSGAPYYGYLTFNGSSRWRFKVSPATPEGVEVAYADNAGTLLGRSDYYHPGSLTPSNYVLNTTTNLGLNSNGLVAITTPEMWAQVSGYCTMLIGSSTGAPAGHSYFGYNVTSRRDSGGGYSALLTGYGGNDLWFTYNGVSSAYPTWRKVWHDGNFTDNHVNWNTAYTHSQTAHQSVLVNPVTGTGTRTAGYIPKFNTDVNTLSDSPIYTDGTNVGIGTTALGYKLKVEGIVKVTAGIFCDDVIHTPTLYLKQGVVDSFVTQAGKGTIQTAPDQFKFWVAGVGADMGTPFSISTTNLNAERHYQLPDAHGTFALTTNIPTVYDWAKAATKPAYSKSEVGLNLVDNTADANKSVSYATNAGLFNNLSSINFARVYNGTVGNINNTTWTNIAYVTGPGNLTTKVKLVMGGTANSVVVNIIADILVSHSNYIYVRSESNYYTLITLLITSDGMNNFYIQAKMDGAFPVTLDCKIFTYAGEGVVFNPVSVSGTGTLQHAAVKQDLAISATQGGGITLTGDVHASKYFIGARQMLSNYSWGGANNNIWIGSVNTTVTGTGDQGNYNIAIGDLTLGVNTTGFQNIAIGAGALQSNTTGSYNYAIGDNALRYNTTGVQNMAVGGYSLGSNTTGGYNLALGVNTLKGNVSGSYNTGVGYCALYLATGSNNTAIGFYSGFNITTGSENTGVGVASNYGLITGSGNTVIGHGGLRYNTASSYNVAIGWFAGRYINAGTNNTAPTYSIFIGDDCRALNANDDNQIVIGHLAVGHGSNTATWGNTVISQHYFSGAISATGSGTFEGGGFNSLRSLKKIHKDWNGNALSVIAKFKVRDFNYKTRLDYDRTLGFIVDEIPAEIGDYILLGENRDAINTYTLHALSFKAHQETKSESDIQKERINILENRVKELEGRQN